MGDAAASAVRRGVLLGLAVLIGAGCGGSGDDAYRLPTVLPDGFDSAARGGCVAGDLSAPAGFLTVFGDDGRRVYHTRQTPAEIRFGVWDTRRDPPDGGRPVTLDDILDTAVPNSVYDTEVDGVRATGFSIRSADPADTRTWPAVVWTEGDLLLWLLGDGITVLEVVEVAESVDGVSRDEFEREVPGEECPSALIPAPATP